MLVHSVRLCSQDQLSLVPIKASMAKSNEARNVTRGNCVSGSLVCVWLIRDSPVFKGSEASSGLDVLIIGPLPSYPGVNRCLSGAEGHGYRGVYFR